MRREAALVIRGVMEGLARERGVATTEVRRAGAWAGVATALALEVEATERRGVLGGREMPRRRAAALVMRGSMVGLAEGAGRARNDAPEDPRDATEATDAVRDREGVAVADTIDEEGAGAASSAASPACGAATARGGSGTCSACRFKTSSTSSASSSLGSGVLAVKTRRSPWMGGVCPGASFALIGEAFLSVAGEVALPRLLLLALRRRSCSSRCSSSASAFSIEGESWRVVGLVGVASCTAEKARLESANGLALSSVAAADTGKATGTGDWAESRGSEGKRTSRAMSAAAPEGAANTRRLGHSSARLQVGSEVSDSL